MRGAHPHDLEGPELRVDLEDRVGDEERPDLDPFDLNDYYADAFCSLLDGGMRTCCG